MSESEATAALTPKPFAPTRELPPCEKYPHDGCGCRLDDGRLTPAPSDPDATGDGQEPDYEGPCGGCTEGDPLDECRKSPHSCGHHCNHSWTHDHCDFCGDSWGEGGIVTHNAPVATAQKSRAHMCGCYGVACHHGPSCRCMSCQLSDDSGDPKPVQP